MAAQIATTHPSPLSGSLHSVNTSPEVGADGAAAACDWFALALDEVDYGIVLLDADQRVLWVNHRARVELDAEQPLRLVGNRLAAAAACDAEALNRALAGVASRGMRRLLTLGQGTNQVGVAMVPLRVGGEFTATMLTIGKRRLCEKLSVESFARSAGLTAAETRVLDDLSGGLAPGALARRYGVALSTVRTQIQSIRDKTEIASIDGLLRLLARLPPLLNVLRSSEWRHFDGLGDVKGDPQPRLQ